MEETNGVIFLPLLFSHPKTGGVEDDPFLLGTLPGIWPVWDGENTSFMEYTSNSPEYPKT